MKYIRDARDVSDPVQFYLFWALVDDLAAKLPNGTLLLKMWYPPLQFRTSRLLHHFYV